MDGEKLISRFVEGVSWRWERIRLPFRRWLTFRGSPGAVRWRWPWPWKKPWQRRWLRVASHGGGIGDELMCTPIFREVRRLNPRCHITFVSRHPEMFATNPHLDEVERFSPDAVADAIYLQYNFVLPPPRPLVTLMAECVGLTLSSNQLEPPVVEPSPELRARLADIAGPWVLIQPQASQWTPNKQWPVASWKRLVELLLEHVEVVEAGTGSLFSDHQFGPRFHSFAGKTNMAEFGWLVSQAGVFVGPPSGGMHFANAFRVPSVVIIGGYEAPDGYDYPWVQRFFTPVECAPCWLTTPCPYQWKCLHAIHPEEVCRAVLKAVRISNRETLVAV
jgi:ADP-heptose:LPS heptosyltransferase